MAVSPAGQKHQGARSPSPAYACERKSRRKKQEVICTPARTALPAGLYGRCAHNTHDWRPVWYPPPVRAVGTNTLSGQGRGVFPSRRDGGWRTAPDDSFSAAISGRFALRQTIGRAPGLLLQLDHHARLSRSSPRWLNPLTMCVTSSFLLSPVLPLCTFLAG
jgi:hypothetical protein